MKYKDQEIVIPQDQRTQIVEESKKYADSLEKNLETIFGETFKKSLDSENLAVDRITLATTFYEMFMRTLGFETNDDNSRETAYRVVKMFLFERGAALFNKPPVVTAFENEEGEELTRYNQYVVVRDIPYYSMCSHHHVTFYGKAHIAYHPKDKVVGISKLARIVHYFAAKPQLQERMTEEIINFIQEKMNPIGAMVVLTGEHLCMSSRGAKATGSVTVTSAIRGEGNGFDKNEVLTLLGDLR